MDADLHLRQGQSRRLLLEIFVRWNELEENAISDVEQQTLLILCVLPGQKPLTRRIQLHRRDLRTDQRPKPFAVRLKSHPTIDEQTEIRKHLHHVRRARVGQQPLEVHLHPRRNPTDEPQVLPRRFAHNRFHLLFPILDAVRLPLRQPVALQIGRHVVGHNPTQAPEGNTARRLTKLRRALQKNHFAINEVGVAASGDVGEQGVARGADVVRHRFAGERNVFRPGSRAGRFAEIERLSRPNHPLLTPHRPLHPRPQAFVIPHGHRGLKIRHRHPRC